jgi:actin related protein 2/3 complex subunit 3
MPVCLPLSLACVSINPSQAYHSAFLRDTDTRVIGNFGLPPLRTKTRGPAYTLPPLPAGMSELDVDADSEIYDILDETLTLFRANTLFRNFEIKGPADRVLIYGILWISECLGKVKPTMSQRDAEKVHPIPPRPPRGFIQSGPDV